MRELGLYARFLGRNIMKLFGILVKARPKKSWSMDFGYLIFGNGNCQLILLASFFGKLSLKKTLFKHLLLVH